MAWLGYPTNSRVTRMSCRNVPQRKRSGKRSMLAVRGRVSRCSFHILACYTHPPWTQCFRLFPRNSEQIKRWKEAKFYGFCFELNISSNLTIKLALKSKAMCAAWGWVQKKDLSRSKPPCVCRKLPYGSISCVLHYHWLRIREDLAVICQYGSFKNPEHSGITCSWPVHSPRGDFFL